jgi:hypothetical protein
MQNVDWDGNGSDVRLDGIKVALVVDNNDPKACERVLVRIIGVHDMENDHIDNAIWADHISFSKFSSGDIPDKGDYLYVVFPDTTSPTKVLWMGWVRSSIG